MLACIHFTPASTALHLVYIRKGESSCRFYLLCFVQGPQPFSSLRHCKWENGPHYQPLCSGQQTIPPLPGSNNGLDVEMFWGYSFFHCKVATGVQRPACQDSQDTAGEPNGPPHAIYCIIYCMGFRVMPHLPPHCATECSVSCPPSSPVGTVDSHGPQEEPTATSPPPSGDAPSLPQCAGSS